MKTIFNNQCLPLLYAIVVFVGSACTDSPVDSIENPIALGTEARQRESGKIIYSIGSNELLEIRVLEIADSRCAEDVVCVWEGEATVSFQIEELEKLFRLCLKPDCNKETISYKGTSFQIELLDVTPYPNTSNPDAIKTATFRITEL